MPFYTIKAAASGRVRRHVWAYAATAMSLALISASCGPAAEQAAAPAATELACAGQVFVTNSPWGDAPEGSQNSISVVDMNTNQVTATIPIAEGPINPTFSPNSEQIYVALSGAGKIAVIDVRTHEIVREISMGGGHPSGLAFTPDGERLVVTLLGDSVQTPGHLQVVTLADGALGPLIPIGAQPERIALTPDGTRAYIVNIGSKDISVVDLAQGATTATIALNGEIPFNILMSPAGDKAYIGVIRGNQIAVIDTATNTVSQRIDIESPSGLAYSPDHQSIYVTNIYGNRVSVLSAADGSIQRTGDGGDRPSHIRLTADGSRAYMARPYGRSIAVLDTATMTVTQDIETGQNPTTVAVCGGPNG